MHCKEWMGVLIVVSLLSSSGLFIKKINVDPAVANLCSDNSGGSVQASSFLCERKKCLSNALVSELAFIKGISILRARAIRNFLVQNPSASVDDLQKISGIGPGLVARIKQRFY